MKNATAPRSLLAVALTLASCAATAPSAQPPPTAEELRALAVFDGATGARASVDDVLAAIGGADAVLLGELHGHPRGLPFHALLVEQALAHHPDAAVALEFLTRDWQHLVDAYLEGVVEWEAVLEALDHAPGNTATDHAPLVELAKAAGRPVYAANAPRTYTRTASRRGYGVLAGLSAEQRRLFDVPVVMPSGPYREGFYDMMNAHRAAASEDAEAAEGEQPTSAEEAPWPEIPDDRPDSFRAQSLWDGTMSATVARALEAGQRPVFLVVGSYHANHDGGTLQLLRRRAPDARVLVVSFVDAWSDALREEDEGLADFVAYVGPYPEDAD